MTVVSAVECSYCIIQPLLYLYMCNIEFHNSNMLPLLLPIDCNDAFLCKVQGYSCQLIFL